MANVQEAPKELIDIQSWVSKAVRTPIKKQSSKLKSEVNRYLKPSKTLAALERLKIYVNDYFPRCMDSLTEDFPGLKTVLGKEEFEHWIEKYIIETPSQSFTLFYLGQHLPKFLETHYKGKNRALVLEMACYEWALMHTYLSKPEEAFDPNILEENERANLANSTLSLQPHIQLLELTHGIRHWYNIKNREKRPIKSDLNHVIIFKNDGAVIEELLKRPFYLLLLELQKNRPLSKGIENISTKLAPTEIADLQNHVQKWFAHAVKLKWFIQTKNKGKKK